MFSARLVKTANRVLHHARLLAFTDGMQLFFRIDSLRGCNLQPHVNSLVENLGLSINIPKCHSITYTYRKNRYFRL